MIVAAAIGVVVDAAAHEVDADVDRLCRHARRFTERFVERAERGEFEQAGDRAAVEVAGAADHLLAERHHPQGLAVRAALGAQAEQFGIRGERGHGRA